MYLINTPCCTLPGFLERRHTQQQQRHSHQLRREKGVWQYYKKSYNCHSHLRVSTNSKREALEPCFPHKLWVKLLHIQGAGTKHQSKHRRACIFPNGRGFQIDFGENSENLPHNDTLHQLPTLGKLQNLTDDGERRGRISMKPRPLSSSAFYENLLAFVGKSRRLQTCILGLDQLSNNDLCLAFPRPWVI